MLKKVRAFDFFKVKVELKIVPLRLDFLKIDFDFEIFFSKSILTLKKLKSCNFCYILSFMVLFIRKLRHKLSYKNRRFGLTSLEKMTIKSVGEHVETLINISTLTGTSKLDKLIKGLSKVYMDMIIADDSSPRTRIKKHPFYTFEQVDPATSYIYFTYLKDDLPRLHRALGLDALGGSVRLENGMNLEQKRRY